ncbi:MAG: hypothetical protein JJ878_21825 [Alphaproteobacteria bacterium]|nr:hypothetical protein [Alphaproteobacteria bacterium]MEC9266725.1 hypothetical protein [Pseudomonadota bacterium]
MQADIRPEKAAANVSKMHVIAVQACRQKRNTFDSAATPEETYQQLAWSDAGFTIGSLTNRQSRFLSSNSKRKGGAGAPPLSGADWLLVNRQTTISEVVRVASTPLPSKGQIPPAGKQMWFLMKSTLLQE